MFINKKFKIESDDLNVILFSRSVAKIGKHIGEDVWTAEGYFANIKEVLKFLVDNNIKGTGLKDLRTVLKEQEKLYALINTFIEQEKAITKENLVCDQEDSKEISKIQKELLD